MHLTDESDHYDVFSDTEKSEFIFRIFAHLCLGGDVCQVSGYSLQYSYVLPCFNLVFITLLSV